MSLQMAKSSLRALARTFLLIVIPAQAQAKADFTTPSIVSNLEPRETAVDIYLPQANNPMSCGTVGWFRLSSGAQNYAAIYAAILTQFARGGSVKVYTNACDTDGTSLIVAAWAS